MPPTPDRFVTADSGWNKLMKALAVNVPGHLAKSRRIRREIRNLTSKV